MKKYVSEHILVTGSSGFIGANLVTRLLRDLPSGHIISLDSIMNINAKGTFFMSQAVARYMVENKIRGHILNVSSLSAKRQVRTLHEMSRWAIRGLTLGMADKLLPYGIVVNAITPGPTATQMLGKNEGDNIYSSYNPLGRYAMPSEIATLATFMVSDMIVGDTFYITGGSGVTTLHG